MSPVTLVDRFTRDRASRFVWGALTLACLVVVLITAQRRTEARNADITGAVTAAQANARDIANTVLFLNLDYATITKTIPAPIYRDIIVALESRAFTDPNIARIRVWRPDGTLQFSTHEREQVGLVKTQDKTLIDQAMKGQSGSARVVDKFTASSTGNDKTPTNLLEVFVPQSVPDRSSTAGVAEVDYYYDTLVQPLPHPWLKLLVVFAVLAGLCLLMTLLSLRSPVRTNGPALALGLEGAAVEPRRAARHAAAPGMDKAAKAQAREAELAKGRAAKAEAEVAELGTRLGDSQDRLKQAEEAYHVLESRLKQAEPGAVTAEVAAAADDARGVLRGRVAELENDIALAIDRAHAAEQRTREAEERASAADDRALEEASRARAAEDAASAAAASALATKETQGSTTAADLASTRADLEGSQAELASTRTDLERAQAELASLATEVAAMASSATETSDALAAAAEKDAEHQAVVEALASAQAARDEAERGLEEARAAADAATAQAEAKATEAEAKATQAQARATEAEARAEAAEAQAVASGEAETKAKAKAKAAEIKATKAAAAATVEPPAPPAEGDALFAKLEERIVAAEHRARDAETQLELLRTSVGSAVAPGDGVQAGRGETEREVQPETLAQEGPESETDERAPEPEPEPRSGSDVTPDAEPAPSPPGGDLRTRLARTASRKKLGGDERSRE